MIVVTDEMRALLALSNELQRQSTLDSVLHRLVDGTAHLLGVEHVSIRLLDATRTLLLTHARAGDPFHQNTTFEFVMGEGLVGWVAKHGEPLRLADAESDTRFQPRPDQTKAIRSFLAVPLIDHGVCVGVLSAAAAEPDRFTEDHQVLLELVAGTCGPHVRYVRLHRLAGPDPVTGVHAPEHLDRAWTSWTDGLAAIDPLCVLVADVDDFSKHRDRFGLGFAEDLLRSVAEGLANGVRRDDLVVRLGRERAAYAAAFGPSAFTVVLPGVGLATAARIAERLHRVVEAELVRSRSDVARVTASFGVVERRDGESRDEVLGRARHALEAARASGGNRVEIG